MKIVIRVLLGLLVLVVVSSGSALAWVWFEDRPVDGSMTKRFQIPAGETLTITAQRLSDNHFVRNPWLFRWLYRVWQGDGSVPSGTFSVPGGLTSWDLAVYFRHDKPLQIRVTVPEGWTAQKIARLLEEKQVVSANDFMNVVHHPSMLGPLGNGLDSLEGRLYPDTYLFPVETPAEEVARIFVQTFDEKTSGWASKFSPDEMRKKLILASIVEREYRAPEEAPVIASVFSNRLDKRIALGSCATIEYILTEILGRPHPQRIFFVHTQIPSPYNTYLNRGLPPGPISNPGMTALKAVFEPAETNYLYFVLADAAKGTHTFSSNWSQHEKAREAYLTTFVTKS